MDHCPHTWFSTEFHTGKGLLKARLRDLWAGPRRRGVVPMLLTLLCVSMLGTMVACGPAAEETSEPLPYEEVDLSALWQQDWGAGEPISLTQEERADYAALLRERMEAAYTVLCDCLGYTPAAQAQGEPRYDEQGRAWYLFPKYASVAEVRAAVDAAFADEHYMDQYLDPDGDPWLRDLDGALWWRGDAYMDGGTFLAPETYCFDSLVLLSRTEDRLDFALVGLGNYYDAPLERFTLVREGADWKLEEYGEEITYLTDDLPGALWLHTMLLWEELSVAGDLAEARVEEVPRLAALTVRQYGSDGLPLGGTDIPLDGTDRRTAWLDGAAWALVEEVSVTGGVTRAVYDRPGPGEDPVTHPFVVLDERGLGTPLTLTLVE